MLSFQFEQTTILLQFKATSSIFNLCFNSFQFVGVLDHSLRLQAKQRKANEIMSQFHSNSNCDMVFQKCFANLETENTINTSFN